MADKKQSFSEAYDELEKITDAFESGEIDLEKAIPQFKKAVKLAKFLKGKLSQMETEIEEIALELEEEAVSETTDNALDDESDDIEF